jgi:hypothetical protein
MRRVVGSLPLLAPCLLLIASGCSVTNGHLVPNSQFAYPNSNVKTLGPVDAEVKKTSWLVQPRLKLEDIRSCYNTALSKAPGANILVNYKEDTTYTQYPFAIFSVRYQLRGEAAEMTVGKQELR